MLLARLFGRKKPPLVALPAPVPSSALEEIRKQLAEVLDAAEKRVDLMIVRLQEKEPKTETKP